MYQLLFQSRVFKRVFHTQCIKQHLRLRSVLVSTRRVLVRKCVFDMFKHVLFYKLGTCWKHVSDVFNHSVFFRLVGHEWLEHTCSPPSRLGSLDLEGSPLHPSFLPSLLPPPSSLPVIMSMKMSTEMQMKMSIEIPINMYVKTSIEMSAEIPILGTQR